MDFKRLRNVFVATALTCSLVAGPVLAAPSTSALEDRKKAAQSEVSSLQSQLNSLMSAMNELEGQLVSKGQEITQAKEDLIGAQEKEAQQYEDMKLRIKYMYEEGNGSALERILTSGSIAELLSEAEYVEKVHTYDRDMLQEYADTVGKINTLKSTLETDMDKLQGLEKDYKTQSEELSVMLNSKQSEVSNLDIMIQEAARAALEEQKKQEEARKAAEQQKPKQGNDGGQDGGQNNDNSDITEQPPQNRPSQEQPSQNQQTQSPPPQDAPNPPAQNQPAEDSNIPAASEPDNSNTGTPQPDYNSSTGNAIVDRAYSWVGNAEYVWGACSPGAFDCSGFVSYCLTGNYSRLGTTFTFLAWPQVSDPQPGDVCVSAGHCGIYIGGGQMIHAATFGVGVIVGPVQSDMIYVRY